MAKVIVNGIWYGFWDTAGLFFGLMSKGADLISQFCYKLSEKIM